METNNRTLATEIFLLGLSNDARTNIMVFVIFFIVYLISINANGLIFYLVLSNSSLHIPMYYFLCILSALDFCIISSIVPRFLVDLISGQKIISLAACRFQVYIILLLGGFEILLLTLMAYDRYAAICRPLHYSVLMRWGNCYRMTASVWILSFLIFVLPLTDKPPRVCYPNQANHFMCDVLVIGQLSCEKSYSSVVAIVIYVASFLVLFLTFVLIIVSYICILFSILKIKSAGRSKAFSTCSSHVMVVVLCYGPAIAGTFVSTTKHSINYEKYFALLTNIICPTLNPLIYCLNNKDIKEAHRKSFPKCACGFSVRIR